MAKNIFNSILLPKVDTNAFDLSHDFKLSFKMGQLVPTCVMECLPGDKFEISCENMLRFAPLVSPVMHRVKVTTHYFFVPNRILWSEWANWIANPEPDQPPPPFFQVDDVTIGSLCDYLGLPTSAYGTTLEVNAFPLAAYLKIWDEYYRDQNLQTQYLPDTGLITGDNSALLSAFTSSPPLNRAWQHDYFTAALPFAQKGDVVQIPLTQQDDIPVEFLPGQGPTKVVDPTTGAAAPSGALTNSLGDLLSGGTSAAIDPDGNLVVDVQAGATDINTLRRAFRLQEWLEKNARAGTRYIENILAHFGVRSSDARLQRPEYIGGSKQNMVISEVLATAETTAAGVSVGTMAGHGISVGGGNSFRYTCEEHGFIIGIINVQPDTAYQQGLHRQFSRADQLDYAWPTFANIGEQEVRLKELWTTDGDPDSVFGYVPRYAEYKFLNSRVAGEMRDSLDFWHLGRIFTTAPALNNEFIKCQPSTRIFAVTSPESDHLYAHIFNRVRAIRKLPRYGIPSI